MNTPATIAALQDLMRTRFPEAHAFRPAIAAVEPPSSPMRSVPMIAGSLTEIIGEGPSSGTGLLMADVIEGGGEGLQHPVALVDSQDAFDPRSVTAEALARLLWVRCRTVTTALRATDLLLRDGNVPHVLLDLQLLATRELRTIPANAWHRLRLLAEQSGTALCVFTAQPIVPCARVRMNVQSNFGLNTLDDSREHALSTLKTQLTRDTTHNAGLASHGARRAEQIA